MAERPPLWPKPIPIIGLSGEYASGKTLFALTIAPGPDTLVYDLEKSSESYEAMGFHRVDAHAEMLKKHPKGYKARDLWVWWRDEILKVPPGRYRVIVLDPVSEIEAGLADYVQSRPAEFGRTANQYAKSSGLMWGDVKAAWKMVLSDLASRCETFAFTAHMGTVYAGNTPTSKRKPKGKETLEELASLYLQMERRPDAKGNVPAVPSAVVRKQRLLHMKVSGASVEMAPALPPRLPVATPDEVRRYMLNPPDYLNLKPEERAPEEKVGEADLADLKARTAEAEAEAERIRLERMDRAERARAKPLGESPAVAAAADAFVAEAQAATERVKAKAAANGHAATTEKANQQQLERLGLLRQQLFDLTKPADPAATWKAVLGKRGVATARDLTPALADELASALDRKIDEVRRSEIPF